MKRSIVRLALVGVALLAPGRAAAQLAGLQIGDTVRVVAPSVGRGIRGALAAVRNDTMYLRLYGRTTAVPMSQVESIEVRRKRSVLAGLGRGVAFGAPIGLASGYVFGRALEGGPDTCADDCGLVSSILAVGGLGAGTVFGALFGATMPGSRWDPVYRNASVGIGPAPAGGVALSLNLKT